MYNEQTRGGRRASLGFFLVLEVLYCYSFHLQRNEHIWMWVKDMAVHLNELSAIAKLIDVLVAQEVWTDQRRGVRKILRVLCHLIPIFHVFLPGCLYDVYALIISDGIGGS